MWIILLPLIVATVAFWAFLAFFGWRLFKAMLLGNALTAAFWLILVAIPLVYFVTQRIFADMREADRISVVSNFEKIPMPTRYPKLLEVYGFITELEIMIYLDVLDIDEVFMLQSRPKKGKLSGRIVKLSDKCIGYGKKHFDTWQSHGRLGYATKEDKACLISRSSSVAANREAVPAIVFMLGTHTTLKLPGNNWASGNYEARLRTEKGSNLLDYWERPFISRSSDPSPWGYGFSSNVDSKKYPAPKRLDFFLSAIGLQ